MCFAAISNILGVVLLPQPVTGYPKCISASFVVVLKDLT